MKWDAQAEEALSRVPFFVRKRVKKRVEEEAASRGAKTVTFAHVRESQKLFLNRMEEEVRGYQVETCFGPGGCPNRAVVSSDLPASLEARLARRDLKTFLKERVNGPLKMHHEFRVSLSDCPNACSRPQIADFALLGACSPRVTEQPCTECGACVNVCRENAVVLKDGRPLIDDARCLYCGQCSRVCPSGTLEEGTKGYRVLVGGKLGRHPRLARQLPGIHDETEALEILDRCLDLHQRECRNGERFGEILERIGSEVKRELTAARKTRAGEG